MTEINYDKLSSMVVKKLEEKNRPERENEFLDKIVDKMVKHRSACHNLNDDEVTSIKDFVKKEKKRDKGRFIITWGIILYILKDVWDFAIANIKWGGN